MHLVLGIVFLVVAGSPLAFALTRRVAVTLVLAPLVTGVVAALAAIAMVAIGSRLWIWIAILLVAEVALAAVLLRRPRAPLPAVSLIDALFYLPFLPPTLQALMPPVVWDARSIWWFHATWFDSGSTAARAALGNSVLAFSHPDYPPLMPATIAGVWRLGGTTSLVVAQAVSTLLTLCAAMLVAYSVRQLVRDGNAWVARFAGLASGLSLWWLASYGITGGYVDHLWAAALAAAAVLLLVDADTASREAQVGVGAAKVGVAVTLLCVAALTKNEGLVATGLLAALFSLRSRHHLRRAAWVWLPVLLGGAWVVVARSHGAMSDLAQSGTIGKLAHGELASLDRVPPTITSMRETVGWFVLAAALVTVLGVLFLREPRRRTGWASTWWLWSLVGAYATTLVATYLISPYEIGWHLRTSIDRVCVPIVVLLAVNTATWLLTATGARGTAPDGSAPDAVPARVPPPTVPDLVPDLVGR